MRLTRPWRWLIIRACQRSKCVHLLNWFDHRNHICLVFELLGMCVYDFLKDNDFAPFPRVQIQSFARQLLDSVACASTGPSSSLHAANPDPLPSVVLHDLHLIHTDLKPENILLVKNEFKTVPIVGAVSPTATEAPLLPHDLRVLIRRPVCAAREPAAQQADTHVDRH